MDDLTNRVERVESRVDLLEATVRVLSVDVAEIKAVLPSLSTKADIAQSSERLSEKIDSAINGLLKDALAAFPAKLGLVLAALSGFAVLVTTVVEILHATGH